MKTRAFAKINLCLDVCGRRQDGYHEVRMIMQSLALFDEISIKRREDEQILMTMEPEIPSIPVDERNLMVRAARLFQNHCGWKQGVDLHLVKRIPSEAGLGGGSADAAAVLLGMNDLFDAGVSKEELLDLGLKLGADVPFCILGGSALAEGIGEILTPISKASSYDALPVLLVKPKKGVSTGAMYRALDDRPGLEHPDVSSCRRALEEGDDSALSGFIANSFMTPVEESIPLIRRIREDMQRGGAFASCMSGSGPTVFGLFRDPEVMREAAERIRAMEYADELSDVIPTSFG